MKRLTLAGLSTLMLSAAFASTVYAKPPSGDLNPSDLHNNTVDTSQVIVPNAQKSLPPAGDLDPTDLHNATVDTSRVIDPHAK
jgi:hypothetical protein